MPYELTSVAIAPDPSRRVTGMQSGTYRFLGERNEFLVMVNLSGEEPILRFVGNPNREVGTTVPTANDVIKYKNGKEFNPNTDEWWGIYDVIPSPETYQETLGLLERALERMN